jgi:uncharacterized protein
MPETVTFSAQGTVCEGWHFLGGAGRPVVVMAHGLGGTKDSGLAAFATGLADAGFHVLAFDYRGFGGSGGTPRQVVSPAAQLTDYRAAMAAAARLPGADPARLVLWGESLSGGTVIEAAAGRGDVAAVISMVPLVDGTTAAWRSPAHVTGRSMTASAARAGAAGLARLAGRPPVLMPLVAEPGRAGALTAPGYRADYLSIAGPTWRNEVDAAIAFDIARFRPIRRARAMPCPWLVQIADFDRSAPPHSAARAAEKGRAEVRHYPCDHFGTQPGQPWHEAALAHQISFLRRRAG